MKKSRSRKWATPDGGLTPDSVHRNHSLRLSEDLLCCWGSNYSQCVQRTYLNHWIIFWILELFFKNNHYFDSSNYYPGMQKSIKQNINIENI